MRISLRHRGKISIAAGLSAVALAGGVPALAATSAATAAVSRARAAVPRGDVLVNCAGRAQVRPGSYVLTCADGNDYLAGLYWVSWSGGAAFGRGTEHVNDCVPNCAEGHFHAYPVLVTAWRAVPRPGHAGQRYFSRMTDIYTGRRPAYYRGPGKKYYPQTVTWQLTGTTGGPRQNSGQ
ncbi:MAG: hypothetical protein ACRDPO_05090 [Streptosporangiaceae bacterium]